jgi:hypothetical protein
MTYRDETDDYDEDEEFDDLEPPEDEEAGDDTIVEVTFAAAQEGAVQ